jgi:hypothetical protein
MSDDLIEIGKTGGGGKGNILGDVDVACRQVKSVAKRTTTNFENIIVLKVRTVD